MHDNNPHYCKYCNAPLLWAQGVSWFFLPLNPDPGPEGKYALIDGRAVEASEAAEWDGPLYQNHRDTCVARKPKQGSETEGS